MLKVNNYRSRLPFFRRKFCAAKKACDKSWNTLYVIRHSERVDEANVNWWLRHVKNGKYSRPNLAVFGDPPITENGIQIAKEMSISMKRHLEVTHSITPTNASTTLRCIYSSRLIRSVQTAYELAKVMNVPLVISSKFSRTAGFIKQYDTEDGAPTGCYGYQYTSLRDIRKYCKDVMVYSDDGDINEVDCYADYTNPNYTLHPKGTVLEPSVSMVSDPIPPGLSIPCSCKSSQDWYSCYYSLMSQRLQSASAHTSTNTHTDTDTDALTEPPVPSVVIVVAHRETIRGLQGLELWKYNEHRRLQGVNRDKDAMNSIPPVQDINWGMTMLPYCAVSSFIYKQCGANTVHKHTLNGSFQLNSLMDSNAEPICM